MGSLLSGRQGTLLVDEVGSLALGFLLYEAIHLGMVSGGAMLAATTGFLSSFATYSRLLSALTPERAV